MPAYPSFAKYMYMYIKVGFKEVSLHGHNFFFDCFHLSIPLIIPILFSEIIYYRAVDAHLLKTTMNKSAY